MNPINFLLTNLIIDLICSNKKPNMHPNDTIGLTEFLVLVYSFLRKNLLLIAGLTILGFGMGYAYNSTAKPYYYSEMTGSSEVGSKAIILETLFPLSSLANEKNYTELSQLLSITEEEATTIRSIEFASSKQAKTNHTGKGADLGEMVLIKVTVYDQTHFNAIEKGITHYLSSNEFLANKMILELESAKRLSLQIENRIQLMDSIALESLNSNKAIGFATNNSSDIIESYKYLNFLKLKIENMEVFTVINGFYRLDKPANKKGMILSALTAAFFLLSILIAFSREIIRLSRK